MPDTALADGDVLTSSIYTSMIRQQVVVQCTSTTRPTGVEGRFIFETDTNRFQFYDGAAWVIESEPFQSWTPTITQGSAVSGTVNRSWYRRSRGGFSAYLKWTASGAGTASNQITISTPLTLVDLEEIAGTLYVVDSGTDNKNALAIPQSTTLMRFVRNGATSAFGASSYTIASGDIFRLSITGRYA